MPVGAVPEERGLVFRFGDLKDGEVHGPTVVRQVLQDRGWREVGEDDPDGAVRAPHTHPGLLYCE